MKAKVYIIDDEPLETDGIVQILKQYDDLDIVTFSAFEQLVKKREMLSDVDVAFVDIRFGDHTGFDVVNLINQYNSKCIFTFFTNYSDYLKQGYEYRIYRYILKEEPENLIAKQIRDTINEFYKQNRRIRIRNGSDEQVILLDDILYIDAFGHTSTFYMTDGGKCTWNKSMSYIYDKSLDGRFIRCHKSYVVNLNHIRSVTNRKFIIMDNNVHLEIGRAYKKEFLMRYSMRIGANEHE